MNLNAPAIDIRKFRKQYDQTLAVNGIDLIVPRGTFFGFVGPNGAGKSTTINTLVGLIRPSDGVVNVVGYDISKEPLEVKARVGFMPEETVLYDRLTASEYLEFAGNMYGLKPDEIVQRSKEYLDLLDLDGSKYMGTFSLGMKKKASLAAALIHRPELIILDEPFSGIDATTSSRIRAALNKMVDEGATVFFSSHVLETVERVSRLIGIIHKGELLGAGTLAELRVSASCPESASLEEVFLTLTGSTEYCSDEELME